MRGILLAIITLVLSNAVFSRCSSVVERAQCAVTEDNLRKHVEYLADDACYGRQPFTEGAQRAVSYLEEEMEAIGLQPISSDGFRQNVPLVMIQTETDETMDIKAPSGTITLHRGVDFVAFTQSRRETVSIKNAELVFAGYGIVAPEYGKNDYQGIDNPSSKIAVVFVNDPGLGHEGDYFSGDTMTYYGRWTYKFEEGARQGLAGVLIIHETRGAGYEWSVVEAGSGLKYALDDPDMETESCPLQGWLSNDAARYFLARCGFDMDVLMEEARKPDFKPFDLNARTSLEMHSTFSYADSPNVVGYIPGSESDCSSIICTAHWDHIGIASKPDASGDSIVNGATDNATAMAWLLETARACKAVGKAPKRNIVFLSPTCEEKGMWGSEYYASHPLFSLENAVAVINLDVIPLWGENNDVTITGYGHTDFDERVSSIAAKYGRYVMADPDSFNGMFYRSDHLPFMRRGVPALFAKGWSDNRLHGKEWSSAKISDYWANTYHKPCDQVYPEDDYSGLKQDVDLFFDLIYSLAWSDETVHWKESSEFYNLRK